MRKKDPERLQEVLDFVDSFYEVNHRTPSTREIAEQVSVSKSSVFNYLVALKESGKIDYDGKFIVTEKMQNRLFDYNRVRLLGNVPCGSLTPEEEQPGDYVDLPAKIFGQEDQFMLKAYGDSMTGAGIDDGDYVIIKQQNFARQDQIVVAYVEGEGSTLKRYREDPKNKRIILHPENPKYSDIVVKDCRIQGVLKCIIKMC